MTYPDIGEENTEPDFIGERAHEAKYIRLQFLVFVDHNADSEGHEGFGKLNYSLPLTRDGQCWHGNVRFLL